MADEVTDEASPEAAKRLRSRNGVPRMPLESIEASVKAIWQVARRGEAASITVARAITGKSDAKASGGAWARRVASLRAFNVIDKGSGFKLSPIGLAIANSADVGAHTRGLRDAVMSIPAYRRFLERADGGELPAIGLLASDIEFEYELSNADAVSAADVFVQSAKYAGLVDDEGRVSLAGIPTTTGAPEAETSADEGDAPEAESPAPAPTVQELPGTPSESEIQPAPHPEVVQIPAVTARTAANSPVTLEVKIDMTEWAADDVVKVLTALGYGEGSREPA